MRVTQSMYYNNIFGASNSRLNQQLFDVNKQIASGQKIQYASDDVRTFTETMRLDNELVTIGQAKKSTESAYKVSNQTDVTLNEFTDSMNRMRTLLLQSANDTNDDTSRDAIVSELKGIEKNLKALANTSINGRFLFSGSAVDVKPIADDGSYQGNDVAMNAFLGSNNQQKYNITGAELFLGEETQVRRTITSNVVNDNLLGGSALTSQSQIRDLMGDKDNNPATINNTYFYVRGTKSDGTSIKEQIALSDNATIQSLMDRIETMYGDNTVNVSLNTSGQIVIEDKMQGSSKLDFHMVGAVDYVGTTANVTNIDSLDVLGADTYPPAGDLYVKEFSKSGLVSGLNIEGLTYDRAEFSVNGSILSPNSPQILKASHFVEENGFLKNTIDESSKNAFAQPSTLLSEVADTKQEILPATNPKTYTMAGTTLVLDGKNISNVSLNVEIKLGVSPSATAKFSVNGGSDYTMYNVDGSEIEPDKMTYQQLMDVMNMVVTDTLPTGTTVDDYHKAVKDSTFLGKTSLSYDGKLEFKDLTNANTQATVALYDKNTNEFAQDASVMTFNSNNSLTVRDPKTDFFKTITEIIQAAESYNHNPDANSTVKRNVGIQNAISMMDDLQDHSFRVQSVVGAQSNTLTDSIERVGILEISTMTLRSSVIDTDIAESSLRLSQLTLNYEAMLSTVGRVSQLSLVNYL